MEVPAEVDLRAWQARAAGRREDGERLPRRDQGDSRRSVEVRILSAWIDASKAGSVWTALVQFESAWLSIQDDIARQSHDLGTIADRYLPPEIDPALRQLFALPPLKAQAELLGHRDDNGVYWPGWSNLDHREYDAITLWLEPVAERGADGLISTRLRDVWEIARDMTPERARRQFGRRAWLKEETVSRYLRSARSKLRLLFGVPNPVPSVP